MTKGQPARGGQIPAAVTSQTCYMLSPGRSVRRSSPWSARVTCGGCGDFYDVERVDSEPLKPSDLLEIATSWDHSCTG